LLRKLFRIQKKTIFSLTKNLQVDAVKKNFGVVQPKSKTATEAQSNYFLVFSVPLRRIFYAKNQTILQSLQVDTLINNANNHC